MFNDDDISIIIGFDCQLKNVENPMVPMCGSFWLIWPKVQECNQPEKATAKQCARPSRWQQNRSWSEWIQSSVGWEVKNKGVKCRLVQWREICENRELIDRDSTPAKGNGTRPICSCLVKAEFSHVKPWSICQYLLWPRACGIRVRASSEWWPSSFRSSTADRWCSHRSRVQTYHHISPPDTRRRFGRLWRNESDNQTTELAFMQLVQAYQERMA